MKRMILTGLAVLTAGLSGLMAQQPAAAPAAPAPAKVPTTKSPAEANAVKAIGTTSDPDAVIKAAEDLMSKFADTEYKEYALTMEARAYQQKGDSVNAQVFGERVLQINPKNAMMELLVGEVIAPSIKEHDLDRDQEAGKASKLFNDAIENIKASPKPNPQLTDKDWADAQQYTIAQAHNDLGVLAQVQIKWSSTVKWDDVIKEYKLAVDGDPEQDAYATRLANAYAGAGKNEEAIALCDKLLAKPNLHPRIKQVVTQIRAQAVAAKK
jgi:tetratricopeptide (TPR) repeat protein